MSIWSPIPIYYTLPATTATQPITIPTIAPTLRESPPESSLVLTGTEAGEAGVGLVIGTGFATGTGSGTGFEITGTGSGTGLAIGTGSGTTGIGFGVGSGTIGTGIGFGIAVGIGFETIGTGTGFWTGLRVGELGVTDAELGAVLYGILGGQ